MNKPGFTLIELLVSTAIIILLIIGTSQAIILSLAFKSRSESSLAAAEAAKARLEYFKSLPFDSMELNPGEYSLSIPFKKNANIIIKWNIQDITPSLKCIELESSAENFPAKKTDIPLYKLQALGF